MFLVLAGMSCNKSSKLSSTMCEDHDDKHRYIYIYIHYLLGFCTTRMKLRSKNDRVFGLLHELSWHG